VYKPARTRDKIQIWGRIYLTDQHEWCNAGRYDSNRFGDAAPWDTFITNCKMANLLDMIHFMAWQLCRVLMYLQDIQYDALGQIEGGDRDTLIPKDRVERQLVPLLAYARRQCAAIEIQPAISRIDEHFSVALRLGATYDVLFNQSRTLRETIESELKYRRFAFVPTVRAEKLDNIDKDWTKVQNQFPSAKDDIRDAVECYALDKNTAAVFHAMRVVEWGLRALCISLGFRRLKRTFKKSGGAVSYIPIEYSEWENILNQLQNRIDAKLNKIKRGSIKQARQEFYYPVLQDIRGIRDAWRNHVMHTRQQYEPTDVDAILEHVKRLMTTLATKRPPGIRL
jgi:hypothetical protein